MPRNSPRCLNLYSSNYIPIGFCCQYGSEKEKAAAFNQNAAARDSMYLVCLADRLPAETVTVDDISDAGDSNINIYSYIGLGYASDNSFTNFTEYKGELSNKILREGTKNSQTI